jgi:hypothetical protein
MAAVKRKSSILIKNFIKENAGSVFTMQMRMKACIRDIEDECFDIQRHQL